MRDDQKTTAELLQELDTLRERVSGLKQAVEEWSKIFDATSDLVFVQDKDFRFVKVNKSVCDLLKVKPEDLIGKKCYEVLHKSNKPWPNCPLAKALKDKRPHTEEVYDPNIGIPLLISTSPLFDENGELTGVVHIAKDITLRKKAEEKLKQYQFMVESAYDAIFFKDLKSRYIIANNKTLEAFGLSREQVIGKNDYEIMANQDEARKNIEDDNLVFKTGKLTEITKRMIGADGKERWFQAVKVPRFDDEGKIIGLVGIARDITERKRAEEEIRASEEKFRGLAERSFDIIFMTDAQGYLTYISPASEKIFHYKPDEMVRTHFKNYLIKSEIPRVSQRFAENMRGENLGVFQMEAMRKDGSHVFIELNSSPIVKDGETIGIQGVIRDITERKKAEDELKRKKERIEKYLDIAEVHLSIVNADESIALINKKGCAILGYKEEELIGRNWFDLLIPKRIRGEVRGVFRSLMAGSIEPVEYYENPLLTKGGQERLIAFHNTVIKDPNGQIVGALTSGEDITEHKKAEEALQESEERLRVALSAAQMGTWRWDPVTNQDTRDASLNLILGLEAVESTQPVEDFLHFVHSEDRDMVDEEIQRAIRERRTYLAEFRIIRPDGTVRWLRDQGKPLCDENDRVLCLTGVVIDMTEHKWAEEKIKLFSDAVTGAIDAIGITDMKGIFSYVNPAMEETFGYKKGELIGEHVSVLNLKPETAEEIMSTLIKTGSWNGEVLQQKKNKETFPALLSLSTIRDEKGTPIGTMGAVRDITERKKAEEALRDSESKYRTLVENLPQKIFLKDKNSVYVSCNENLAKDFKIKPEEIAGKTDYDLLPEELAEKYRADDKRIIESGQTESIEEKYIQQGKERIIHTVKTPVKDEQGKVIGVLGIFWDITELKQAQEKLSKYREKMARAEQLASVGTLSATLAHELTQPLTVIRLSIENALAKLEATSSAATVTKKLDDSLTEVSNVTSIVERFRNYARRSSKRIAGEVDLKAVAERTVQLLSESAWRARVTLHLEGMDKLPPIYSSEKDIEQLFFALVVNAVQAADGKKNRQLIISGDVKDEHVELRFSDDCGGIAPENLNRIFEPFFTTRPASEGTGLGLCIVKQIVSRAGGKVRVESESGKGSTFFVTLPVNKGKGS